MNHVVGVDVGGTKILIGLLDENGVILYSKKYPMQKDTQEHAVSAVFESIDNFMNEINKNQLPKPNAIGMGTVGHIDYEKGIWMQSYNIPISKPVLVADILEKKYGIPVKLDNDVHCATLGEHYFGQGKHSDCMIFVNVGTGLSAGIVHQGMLIRGAKNYAGEIGFMQMNCESNDGVLEPVASGGGLIAQARKQLSAYPCSVLAQFEREDSLHSSSIFQAALQGDELAIKLTERAVLFLGSAICSLMAIFNPDTVVFGGGVVKDIYFCNRLYEYITLNCVGETKKALKFLGISELDPSKIGLIGASSLHRSAF